MNVNDESLKKLTTVLTNDKKKEITKLPWKHGFADSLKSTLAFLRQFENAARFACITKIKDKEVVVMPFELYLELLQERAIARSLDEEQ
tara:strand:- start:177 stop:443 length:267 start_codon:yes stop_codon:yes gene_type:complete